MLGGCIRRARGLYNRVPTGQEKSGFGTHDFLRSGFLLYFQNSQEKSGNLCKSQEKQGERHFYYDYNIIFVIFNKYSYKTRL